MEDNQLIESSVVLEDEIDEKEKSESILNDSNDNYNYNIDDNIINNDNINDIDEIDESPKFTLHKRESIDDDDDDDDNNNNILLGNIDDEEYTNNNNNNNNNNSWSFVSSIKIHTDIVNSITISRQQPLIATTGDDNRLVLYSITSNNEFKSLRRIKKKYLPLSISFDNTGDCLAIAMVDGTIEIWDVTTMKPIYTLYGHTGSVLNVEWSPAHRNILASISNDCTIRLWHPHSMRKEHNFVTKKHPSFPCDLKFQPINNKVPLLATSDQKGTVRIYDSSDNNDENNNNNLSEFYVGRSIGNKIAIGEFSLIGTNGYDLNVLDIYNKTRGIRLKGHNSLINNVDISQDIIASSDLDNNIYLWSFDDISNNNKINKINKTNKNNNTNSNNNNNESSQLLSIIKNSHSINDKYTINENNNNNNKNNNKINNEEKNYISNLKFLKNSKWLLSSGNDGTLKLWDCQKLFE